MRTVSFNPPVCLFTENVFMVTIDLMKVKWREFTEWYGDGEIWSSKQLVQLCDRVLPSTQCIQLVKANYRVSNDITLKM